MSLSPAGDRPLARAPRAVVFDMDGLLLDTERLWMAAMGRALADHGRVLDEDFYLTILGTPWLGARQRLVEQYGHDLQVDNIRPAWEAHFVELCRERLQLKSGVLEILDVLDQLGIPAAIATSSPRALAFAHLDHLGLRVRFQHIVAEGDYERGKPDPAPYLLAASRLGVAPGYCLALEDSFNGVRSASAAGMMTIMVPDLIGPTAEIASLCVGTGTDLYEVISLIRRTCLSGDRADPWRGLGL